MKLNNEIVILLPETIYIKKMKKQQELLIMQEEYNIYYKNIIQPYDEKWDIVINCEYGNNLGNCWRLSDYNEELSEFFFELLIYDEYGNKLASKKSKIVMVDRKENTNTRIMFIGDSMTHRQVYVNHIVNSLKGIETIGSRCFDGHIKIEGRGGWRYESYYNNWYENFGLSPFLFPKGIEAKDYYGDVGFIKKTKKNNSEVYIYYGYDYGEMKNGHYYIEDKKLYKKNNEKSELVSEKPQFEFDFSKYLERFNLETPEIISILMGANDLQICPYEESEERVTQYIENTKLLVEKIHKHNKKIKIIINLPISGAEQYCWGTKLGCYGSEKMYRFNIMRAVNQLIKSFDNRQKDNIYLSPMIACIDPENGFPYTYVKANKYNESMLKKQSNWVHPNDSGYCQMGDALAGVIEYIR